MTLQSHHALYATPPRLSRTAGEREAVRRDVYNNICLNSNLIKTKVCQLRDDVMKILNICVLLVVFMSMNSAHAEYDEGTIQDLAVNAEGVYVSLVGGVDFPSLTCSKNSSEALLPFGTANYVAMVAFLMTLYTAGKPVKIWASSCHGTFAKIGLVRDAKYPNY